MWWVDTGIQIDFGEAVAIVPPMKRLVGRMIGLRDFESKRYAFRF